MSTLVFCDQVLLKPFCAITQQHKFKKKNSVPTMYLGTCLTIHYTFFSKITSLNPLLHNDVFWRLWNSVYLKILWKMEHLLF